MMDLSLSRGRRNVIQSKDAGFGQRKKEGCTLFIGGGRREGRREKEEGREREREEGEKNQMQSN